MRKETSRKRGLTLFDHASQAEAVRRALDYLYAVGRWTVVIDEALYVAKNLRLAEELEVVWHEGQSSRLSLVACSQRPSWLPKSAYSAPTYLVMFGTNDPEDLKRHYGQETTSSSSRVTGGSALGATNTA
jgi:hypothetical protein